jgi:hypothetical protein
MRMGFKRYPAEGSLQSTLDNIPEMRAFAKVDEIERVEHWLGGLGEIADAPKWDRTIAKPPTTACRTFSPAR